MADVSGVTPRQFDRWRQEFFADWRAELDQRRAA